MTGTTLAAAVRQLAYLHDIRGEDGSDLRASVDALDRLSPAEVAGLLQAARDGHVPGVHSFSPRVQRTIRDVALVGADAATAALRSRIPGLLRHLLETAVVTHDQAAAMVRDLGIVTVDDLDAAVADDRLDHCPEPLAERLRAAASLLAQEWRPYILSRAWELLETVRSAIATACPLVTETCLAGDTRRYEPLVKNLAIVAVTADTPGAIACLAALPGVEEVVHRSGRRAILNCLQSEIDVRFAAADDLGTILFTTTGSHAHVSAITKRRRPGLCAREADVYARAGLAWIPPEIRHDSGEIEAAASGRLPQLVSRGDIRGDLHMHTTFSDGQDTLETMIAAAAALGYEYIAITDHSPAASASRTITADGLKRQREAIDALRDRYPAMTILRGAEVDILPDGSLDFPDAVLEDLDIVLASLHDAAGQDGPTLTLRCIRAMRHPLVNVITHPTNRLVGRRDPYPLDYPAIYAAAAETGTVLEIDGGPSHLDLDGERAREAVAAGVTVTIDSDCHRARALDRQMGFGVGTARRGWVESRHVLNARPLAEVRAFVTAKRNARRP
ncbi:MAG TPA: PHP domain-containing protein [Vicinamibacterales bacterium]